MRLFPVFLLLFVIQAAYGQVSDTALTAADTLLPVNTMSAFEKKQMQKEPMNPYLQDTLLEKIPMARVLFHDKIDNEQKRADIADGTEDSRITVPGRAEISAVYTAALIRDVDRLQIMIENMPANGRDSVAANQQKIQSLRAVWEMLRHYNGDPKPQAVYYRAIVANLHDVIVAANEQKSLPFTMANANIYTLDNAKVLLDNQPEARAYIYTTMGERDPEMIIRRLEEYARDTFAGRMIALAAMKAPKLVFNYALSSNTLIKTAVYHTHDPYVQAIVQLTAESESPLKALPFVSYLYRHTASIEQIDSIAADPVSAYEHLVALRISGEPLSKSLYSEELEYRTTKWFVRPMNEQHDTNDVVRFACIDSLPASSLYYIMVYGREEIYTSSFLGTFRRMIVRMDSMPGNVFLDSLKNDQFRTFIRLCAGYNTLPEFLATMDEGARSGLMARFMGGLEQGAIDDLEDAVNVADALGSIQDTALMTFLRKRISDNYEHCRKIENKKGMAVYRLLSQLSDSRNASATDTGAARASKQLNIPPVNVVPFASLDDDTGAVAERIFFYGDEDGKNAYDGFVADYKNATGWKLDTTAYWISLTSTEGKHVTMYANKPLKEPDDEVAIDSLDDYLRHKGIYPTIVVHRGHSYHVKTTLEHLDTNAHIVVLGSCGGYQNVTTVLKNAPDAHIISSKQTGVGAINEPITKAINTSLAAGKDIDWISLWAELDTYFQKRKELYERFADYVPPHRNMGVIFIKAYDQMMQVNHL